MAKLEKINDFYGDILVLKNRNPNMSVKFKRDGILYDEFFFVIEGKYAYVGIEKINEYYVPEKFYNYCDSIHSDVMPENSVSKQHTVEEIYEMIRFNEVYDFRVSLTSAMFKNRFRTSVKKDNNGKEYYEIELYFYTKERYEHFKMINAKFRADSLKKSSNPGSKFFDRFLKDDPNKEIREEWHRELDIYIKEHNL